MPSSAARTHSVKGAVVRTTRDTDAATPPPRRRPSAEGVGTSRRASAALPTTKRKRGDHRVAAVAPHASTLSAGAQPGATGSRRGNEYGDGFGVDGDEEERAGLGALDGAELGLDSDEGETEEQDGEGAVGSLARAAGGIPSESEGDEFPEIDVGESDEGSEAEGDAGPSAPNGRSSQRSNGSRAAGGAQGEHDEQDEAEDDASSEELPIDDETDGSEEGYDSDDIDQWDDEAEDALAEEMAERSSADEAERKDVLDKMLARATVKPDEAEATTNKLGLTRRQAAPPLFPGRNADGSARGEWRISSITGQPKRVYPSIEPDYDSDSSTEDAPNRIGNVPLEWYDDLPHIGYDVEGRKVLRPAVGDELDRFLATVEDPDAWTSARDKLTGKDVKLTDEELDIIRRLQRGEIADASYDPYEDYVPWYTGPGKEMATPLSARPEPKSRFVPSKWEHKKVMKIVRAIRQGRIQPHAPKQPAQQKPAYYNIWSEADAPRADHPMHMPAPKLPLPGHAESYNPPAEYLFDDEERKQWLEAEAEDRKLNFMPQKYASLRLVPGYEHFVKERFERCLDLYMAPRVRKKRLDVDDAQKLLPKLPSPRELRPFPTTCAVTYAHPNDVRVRCLSVDPKGNWLVTGADDGRVRLWDLGVGRCAAVWDMHAGAAESERGAVASVEWCPNRSLALFAAVSVGRVLVIAPPQCSAASDGRATESPSFKFASAGYQPAPNDTAGTAASADTKPSKAPPARWGQPSDAQRRSGVAASVSVSGRLVQVAWHSKGDYFATVAPDAGARSVLVHQLSRQRTQAPFSRASKGSAVQRVRFHPLRPQLLVATQRIVRIYDLSAQRLVKTLQPGLRWISSLDVHPRGDHVLVGSYDRKLAWFDLDLSSRPYKTLRYHARAVRSVAFHASLPLFASASDDATAHVLHATVYADLATSPLLVPLKVLRGHAVAQQGGLGVLECRFHPTQPWLVTAGADGDARLWTT